MVGIILYLAENTAAPLKIPLGTCIILLVCFVNNLGIALVKEQVVASLLAKTNKHILVCVS